MKKLALLFTASILGFGALHAQTLTIHNISCIDMMFYSGTVKIGSVDYYFGSETNPCSIVSAGATVTFTATSGACGYSGPTGTSTTTSFVGFKMRRPGIMGPYTAGLYISAASPFQMSSPLDPAGCDPNPYLSVSWTGPVANPVVYILP
jgi:hypothetical protein